MKISKNFINGFFAVAAMSVASMHAFGVNTVQLYYDSGSTGYSYGVGGEFNAVASSTDALNDPAGLGYITDVTSLAGGFQTFCIEYHEEFTPANWGNSTPYSYSLSGGAISGGAGAHYIDPSNPALGTTDTISIGTAWLYRQFATGVLDGYDYTFGIGRENSANALQNAIWYLEDEISLSSSDIASNPFLTLAQSSTLGLGLSLTGLKDNQDIAHYYGVDALNLGAFPGFGNQDQLVLAPGYSPGGGTVPDGGSTIALLGGALVGLGILRRKLMTLSEVH